jgi:hypothetical protein
MLPDNKRNLTKFIGRRTVLPRLHAIFLLCFGTILFALTGGAGASQLTIDNPQWSSAHRVQVEYAAYTEICDDLGGAAGTCDYEIPEGTLVTLTALPGNAAAFIQWAGAVSDTTNPITFVKDLADQTVTANFNVTVATWQLALTVNGGGGQNSIQLDFASTSVSCDSSCVHYIPQDESVTLTATVGSMWLFEQWGGDLSGSNITESFTISANQTVTATFQLTTATTQLQSWQFRINTTTSASGPGMLPASMPLWWSPVSPLI